MKKFLALILVVFTCISFCGCCSRYELEKLGDFDVGYSKRLNDAYLGAYYWDGTQEKTNIVVPEEYKGAPISSFGGYSGSGYPSAFGITLTDSAKEKLCDKSDEWWYMSDFTNNELGELQVVNFTVHISQNIEEIKELRLGGFIGCEYGEEGEEMYDIFVFLCYVTCDENNKTFYAKDGKLYYKQDDKPVSDIYYYDFDLEKYMSDEREGNLYHSAF